jgi:hypothetical protein
MSAGIKLNTVIQLIDGFSGLPAIGLSPRFLVNQKPYSPLAKPEAFYDFSELEAGNYQLLITDREFFSQQITVRIPIPSRLADGIIPCRLQPNPLYSYPADTTLVRGLVELKHTGLSLPGVTVQARYLDWRGNLKNDCTYSFDEENHEGRYALALSGKLVAETEVELSFSKLGHKPVQRHILIRPGTTRFIDIETTLTEQVEQWQDHASSDK